MPAATIDAGRMAAAPFLPRVTVSRREARLRPEQADLYPGLVPGQWESAAMLADRVLAARLLRGRDLLHPGRILADAHFEFRGGQARDASVASRPRREDR
jgi:hypothetical protein